MQHFTWQDMWRAGWSWQPERTLLNQVIDQTSTEVAGLDFRITALTREVLMLRTIVDILIGTLRDTKAIDDAALDARLQEAIKPIHEAHPPHDLNASLSGPASQAARAPITCIRCRGQFDPAKTMMTADGAMCDSCSAKP
jgi:hypothetical protein